jgi:hypothetical protein
LDPDFVSDFSILFDDTGDGLLHFNEVVYFSGVTQIPDAAFFGTLLHVPDIPNGSINSQDFLDLSIYTSNEWDFSDPPFFTELASTWEYNISIVPLPGALPLFASALGVMGLLGWRRKRKQTAAAAAA